MTFSLYAFSYAIAIDFLVKCVEKVKIEFGKSKFHRKSWIIPCSTFFPTRSVCPNGCGVSPVGIVALTYGSAQSYDCGSVNVIFAHTVRPSTPRAVEEEADHRDSSAPRPTLGILPPFSDAWHFAFASFPVPAPLAVYALPCPPRLTILRESPPPSGKYKPPISQ